MASIPNILRRPITLSEKAATLKAEQNQVIFEVTRESTKPQIRAAVEGAFGVKVLDVRTLIMRGKDRRMGRGYGKMQNWKKAFVTLKAGDSIDFYGEASE